MPSASKRAIRLSQKAAESKAYLDELHDLSDLESEDGHFADHVNEEQEDVYKPGKSVQCAFLTLNGTPNS